MDYLNSDDTDSYVHCDICGYQLDPSYDDIINVNKKLVCSQCADKMIED